MLAAAVSVSFPSPNKHNQFNNSFLLFLPFPPDEVDGEGEEKEESTKIVGIGNSSENRWKVDERRRRGRSSDFGRSNILSSLVPLFWLERKDN